MGLRKKVMIFLFVEQAFLEIYLMKKESFFKKDLKI